MTQVIAIIAMSVATFWLLLYVVETVLERRERRMEQSGGLGADGAGASVSVWRGELAASRSHALPLTREAMVALALLAAAVAGGGVLRFWNLGARALHHDESLHATYSWYLAEGRGYTHDPLMHGPFQFHATALSYVLFGDGNYQARIMAALFGTALIAMAWLLRDRIGAWGAVFLGAFLAFSPTMLYFSRFIREDIFTAVWTLGLVIALWRYVERRQSRYLVVAAAMLALSFATKETTFITVAVFITYFDLHVAWELAEQTHDDRDWPWWQRGLVAALYAPFAWAIVALWPLLGASVREPLRWRERTPAMDVVLLLGTLTVPQLAAVIGAPIEDIGGLGDAAPAWFRPSAALEATIGTVTVGALYTVVALVVATAAAGMAWDWRKWALCGLVFYGIYFTLFTTFYTNLGGISSGIWGSLDYWIEQQDVQRGDQPGFYYLMLLPVYEFVPLLIGLGAAVPLLLKGNAFTRFLLVWFGGMLLGLSLAGEKMPWLSMHMTLPLAILAAYGANAAVRRIDWRSLRPLQPRVWALGAAAAAFATLAVVSGWWGVRASFGHGADGAKPVEMLVYTQTSPELLDAFHKIEEFARTSGQGKDLPIYVDLAEGLSWPWAWYLRDYKNALYVDLGAGFQPPPGSAVLVYAPHIIPYENNPQWNKAMTYAHRWWFPEFETYKRTGPLEALKDANKGSTWTLWRRYFLDRTTPAPIGAAYSNLYLPAKIGN